MDMNKLCAVHFGDVPKLHQAIAEGVIESTTPEDEPVTATWLTKGEIEDYIEAEISNSDGELNERDFDGELDLIKWMVIQEIDVILMPSPD